eukprot:COSAG02_NODE_11852_length_1642_cov_18.889825_2_plen_97_part_00
MYLQLASTKSVQSNLKATLGNVLAPSDYGVDRRGRQVRDVSEEVPALARLPVGQLLHPQGGRLIVRLIVVHTDIQWGPVFVLLLCDIVARHQKKNA